MKMIILLASATLLVLSVVARGDAQTETIQQKLKDQGFYYGAVTGKSDTDTTAAIRRFQIRNGLKVSGEVDAETAKSLGVSANSAAKPSLHAVSTPLPRTASTPTPRRTATLVPASENPLGQPQNDLRSEPNIDGRTSPAQVTPYAGYAPGPRGLQPEVSGIFDGTPFEVAPPDVQRRVIVGAQALLAQGGFYRGAIDGVYGRGLQYALRTYQARRQLSPTGALDLETLASLGLLPGQRARDGFNQRRWSIRPHSQFAPTGERIYEPY